MKFQKTMLVALLCAPLLAQTCRAGDSWNPGPGGAVPQKANDYHPGPGGPGDEWLRHHHGHAGPYVMHAGWGGGDIRRFHERDMDLWRHGRWYQGNHGGRMGWWWIVAGVWYFYPQPVYPMPDPYVPPMVVAPAGGPYWYYCRNPAGYYPYVPACRHWMAVPVQYEQAPAPQYQEAPAPQYPPPAPQ